MTSNATARMAVVARWVLATGLLVTALAKLVGGSPSPSGFPKSVYGLTSVVEAALAVALVSRHLWRAGACATVCFGVLVAAIPYFVPMRTCGCLGSWVSLGPFARVGAGIAICVLGGLALVLQPGAPPRGVSAMGSSSGRV